MVEQVFVAEQQVVDGLVEVELDVLADLVVPD